MKNHNFKFLSAIAVAPLLGFAFIGNVDPAKTAGHVLYVAGSFGVMKDGVLQDGYGHANSVFVSGNDVYAAGHGNNDKGIQVAMLWKNGAGQNLSDGKFNAGANSVFVSGSDVYVAGWEKNTQGADSPRLWKNGAPQNLVEGYSVNSVFVSSGDVYVAGSFGLLKNGSRQGSYGWLNSVFVSGNDVYVAGHDDWSAKLWKNDTAQGIGGTQASAMFVFVSGNDVYAAGFDNFSPRTAVIWKNRRAQVISDRKYEARANSVFVLDDDVYVAGRENDAQGLPVAMLWKNGQAQALGRGEAYSVVAVAR